MNDLETQSPFDNFLEGAADFLPQLPGMILTLLIGAILIQLALWLFVRAVTLIKTPPGLASVLRSILAVILWISLVIVIFISYGFNQIALYLSGSTAILLFILSSGASSLIADAIAGITLASDKHFRSGLRVIAGDKQTEGEIVSMDARKTRVRDDEGRLHVIPNSLIEKNEWIILDEKKKD